MSSDGYYGRGREKGVVENHNPSPWMVLIVLELTALPLSKCQDLTQEPWPYIMQLPGAVWTVSSCWWSHHQSLGKKVKTTLKPGEINFADKSLGIMPCVNNFVTFNFTI